MPRKGYVQTPEHREKIRAMRARPIEGERPHALATNHRHGMCGTPTYRSWSAMRQRCAPGGKYHHLGVRVCERWKSSFESFLADMGARPEGCTLDRIDPFGDYEPSNCRWAPADQQAANTRRTSRPRGAFTPKARPVP